MVVLLMMVVLGGCEKKPDSMGAVKDKSIISNRFVAKGETYYLGGMDRGNREFRVVKDTKTGVLYLWDADLHGGGLTPLLDSEGKPTIEK